MTTANMAEAPPLAGTRHPLDPLDGAELGRARRRRARGGRRSAPRALRVRRAARAGQGGARGLARGRRRLRRARRASSCSTRRRRGARGGRDGRGRQRARRLRGVPGVQAAITADEYAEAERRGQGRPRLPGRARPARHRRRRAGDDRRLVGRDRFEEPGAPRRRARCRGCAATSTGDNGYARPIGGLVARRRPQHACRSCASTTTASLPVPPEHGDYRDGGGRPYRERPAADRDHAARGRELRRSTGCALVRWGPGACGSASTPREALDAARARLRAATARVRARSRTGPRSPSSSIPYGDTEPDRATSRTRSTSASTASGRYVNSLELGCDCLGEIRYLDADRARRHGRGADASATPSACTRRTTGILWKHFDWRSGATEVRRARRLVVSSIVTVGNYEYGLLLVPLRWTARSPSRPSSRASCTPPAWPEGGRAASPRWSRPAWRRRLPPALLLRPARPGRRRRAQRARRGRGS